MHPKAFRRGMAKLMTEQKMTKSQAFEAMTNKVKIDRLAARQSESRSEARAREQYRSAERAEGSKRDPAWLTSKRTSGREAGGSYRGMLEHEAREKRNLM